MSEKRCSLCGASRMDNGACSLLGCRDPLFDQRAEEAIAAAEERGRRVGIEERDELRTYALALRQQVEDTILVAKADADGEWITAYHFQTGAIHRLLAKAREPIAALAPRDSGKEWRDLVSAHRAGKP